MNNKLLLLLILSLVTSVTYSQSRRKKAKQKTITTIGLSGGYFNHGKLLLNQSENTFSGFKTSSLELQLIKNQKIKSFDLDFLYKSVESMKNTHSVDETRFALALNYQLLYKLKKSGNISGLYLGGFAGLLYDQAKAIPNVTLAYPLSNLYISLWSGPILKYNYHIQPKMLISASTKIGLLEIGKIMSENEDPQLPVRARVTNQPNFDSIKRFNLNLGIHLIL